MDYKMVVIIRDPNTEEGMNSDIVMNLQVNFSYDPNQYGNGHYVSIEGEEGFHNVYDIRYDHDFDRNKKEVWLTDWAHNYWSGNNGAYEVKSLTIEKL